MANKIKNNSKKTELSLSAIMFFSPLIQNFIKKNQNISREDKLFVKGFINLGYFNILLLTFAIILQIIFYINKIKVLQIISVIIMIILGISLIIGSILIISDKPIINNDTTNTQSSKNNINSTNHDEDDIFEKKLEIFSYYLPIYNIYLRYKEHNFENPNIILKESIIIRSLYAIFFISIQSTIVNWILISLLTIKIIATLNNLQTPKKLKDKINLLFYKNPEEIRGHIIGFIKIQITHKKTSYNTEKEKYSLLLKTTRKEIIIEYSILYILSIYGLYLGYINQNSLLIFSIIFIISRYIIMQIRRKHLPHLPIINDIISLFLNNKIKQGTFTKA